jgi:hypothetical protein
MLIGLMDAIQPYRALTIHNCYHLAVKIWGIGVFPAQIRIGQGLINVVHSPALTHRAHRIEGQHIPESSCRLLTLRETCALLQGGDLQSRSQSIIAGEQSPRL